MKVSDKLKYDVFINVKGDIKDEYKNVHVRIDDIFVSVTLANGRIIGYPICNILRLNITPNKDGVS